VFFSFLLSLLSLSSSSSSPSLSEWLRALDPHGADIDWRMLNAGWAMADAVVSSGAILRQEQDVTYTPRRYLLPLSHLTGIALPPVSPLASQHPGIGGVQAKTGKGKAAPNPGGADCLRRP